MDHPDEAQPQLLLHYLLSPLGQQDAFRKGVVVSRQASVTLTPDSADWDRAVQLQPSLNDDGVGELQIGNVVAATVKNAEPVAISGEVPSGEPFGEIYWVWRQPFLDVDREAIAELDFYPDVSDLLAFEEQQREQNDELIGQARDRLDNEMLPAWRRWVDADLLPLAKARLAVWEQSSPVVHHRSKAIDRPLLALAALADIVAAERPEAGELVVAFEAAVTEVAPCFEAFGEVERKRQELSEATAWVEHFGSSRLKKALQLGYLSNSLSVYREERLAHELPGWRWLNGTFRFKGVVNPTENALDLLAEARGFDPGSSLTWMESDGSPLRGLAVRARFLGRDVYRRVK